MGFPSSIINAEQHRQNTEFFGSQYGSPYIDLNRLEKTFDPYWSYQNIYSMWKSNVSTHFMTLPVAKNCKMTNKFDIDDVINMSKMSDMPQNFLRD